MVRSFKEYMLKKSKIVYLTRSRVLRAIRPLHNGVPKYVRAKFLGKCRKNCCEWRHAVSDDPLYAVEYIGEWGLGHGQKIREHVWHWQIERCKKPTRKDYVDYVTKHSRF